MSVDRTRISFKVFGTEFCRVLKAVALFQAQPKDFGGEYAAVRCLARGDGLSLAATNGASVAGGHVVTEDVEGVGPFSFPHAQVKAVLAIFDRRLPKDTHSWDYVLEVTVTEQTIRIEDVSVLFDGDSFTMAVPHEDTAERGDRPESELVMNTLAILADGFTDQHAYPHDLAAGIYFSSTEVGKIARAAKSLGIEVHLRQNGRRLLAPLAEEFVAFTAGSLHESAGAVPPHVDEQAITAWRDRLTDVLDSGVI